MFLILLLFIILGNKHFSLINVNGIFGNIDNFNKTTNSNMTDLLRHCVLYWYVQSLKIKNNFTLIFQNKYKLRAL